MLNFIAQPGLATAGVDFTSDFSPLVLGLFGLLALCAGLITFVAVQYHKSQAVEPVAEGSSVLVDHRDAA